MSWIIDLGFWKDTAERVLSTAAQGGIIGWGVDTLDTSTGGMPAWGAIGIGLLGGAVLTLLKCIATAGATKGNPSLGKVAVPASQVAAQVETTTGGADVVTAGEAAAAVPEGVAIEDLPVVAEPFKPQHALEE